MKVLISNYTFTSAAGTISFDDYVSIDLKSVLLVTNVTDNIIIYNFASIGKGGTVATNVLTLDYDTSAMSDGDDLQIYYDDPAAGSGTGLTDAELRAAPVEIDVTNASIPVTGTFWQATQPVSIAVAVPVTDNSGSLTVDDGGGSITVDGPLTDAQLRATAVPVSGTISTGLSQPLTDTQLRASNVDINITNPSLAVTGTFWQATQPVSGPLTDAQLRATPVPVSGTISTGLSQPLTDTQLRATPVPISGTVTANTGLTQPLTDAQLRAADVDVNLTNASIPVTGTFWQATQPVSASNLDIRDLVFATDKVDVSGSTIATSAAPTTYTAGTITKADIVVTEPQYDGIHVSGTPTVGSYVVSLVPDGASTFVVQFLDAFLNTYYFEGSTDSTNGINGEWVTIEAYQVGISSFEFDIAAYAGDPRTYTGSVLNLKYFRVRAIGSDETVDMVISFSANDIVNSDISGLRSVTTIIGSVRGVVDYAPTNTGNIIIGKRNDTAASFTDTDGDASWIATDAAGRIGITDLGGSITVDGSITANAGTDLNTSLLALEMGGNLDILAGVTSGANVAASSNLTMIGGVRNDAAGFTFATVNGNTSYIATDANGRVGICDLSGSITVDGTVAFSNTTIAVTNTGTFATQATLQSGTNYVGKVRLTDGTTDGEIVPLAGYNAQAVAIVDGSGNQISSFGGGTEYTEGDTDASITGSAILWEDTSDTLRAVSAAKPLPVDVKNSTLTVIQGTATNLKVQAENYVGGTVVSNANPVPISDAGGNISIDDGGNVITVDGTIAFSNTTIAVTNAGTFATQESQILADNAGFTDGTTKVFAAGYIYDEIAGTALTENDVAAARINVNRGLVNVIEDGTTRGRYATVTASNAIKVDGSAVNQPVTLAAGATSMAKAEDVASGDGDVGSPAMAVRKATPANTSNADGDYEFLQMSNGALWTTELGFPVSISTDVTRQAADTTQYAVNDAISNSTSAPTSGGFTFTGAARKSGGSGIITDIIMMSSATPATTLQGELIIFNTSVTNINDNAAFVVSDAELKTVVAKVPFTLEDMGNNSMFHAQNLAIMFTTSGSADLRFLLRAKNTYVPVGSEVLTFILKIIQID